MNFAESAHQLSDYIVGWRRHFHQYPELSFHEVETTETLCRELTALGIPFTRYDEQPGVLAKITGSRPGGSVLLRADIDALPIRENTGLPYASENGAMHACGHDCHTAMLLGAAKLLQENRDELCGSVYLLFQSGEETCRGATYYIEKGCLEGVDAVFGMHIWSEFPAPMINLETGPRMASCDSFELIVHGKAAHGAAPHMGCDAIVAAGNCLTVLQSYIARCTNAFDPLVITVGTIHGGEVFNIVCDRVSLTGTARCFSPDVRARLQGDLEKLFASACAPYGCTAELIWKRLAGAVINDDPKELAVARAAAIKLYGEEGLCEMPPLMVSEDYAYYGEHVPSVFGFLGGGNPEIGAVYPHHNECFLLDEAALTRGAALYAQFAVDYLNQN